VNQQAAARSRIVVAVDANTSDLPIVIARHLSRDPATELVGLFVEDRRLFEHASAALAREVAYTGHVRPLEQPKLERQLRAYAAEARRRFESGATRLALTHGFHVLRGDVVAELVREATHAEALVVEFTAEQAIRRGWSSRTLRELVAAPLPALLVAREAWLTGHGIVAVFADHGDPRALDAVVRLAHRSLSPLTVLLAADTDARRQALTESLQAQLSAANVELRGLLAVADLTLETIVRASQGARLLVLAHRSEPRARELAAELAARTSLPLLVVNSNSPPQ
jgi:hypothetical protein